MFPHGCDVIVFKRCNISFSTPWLLSKDCKGIVLWWHTMHHMSQGLKSFTCFSSFPQKKTQVMELQL
jgi:hypothetical protein